MNINILPNIAHDFNSAKVKVMEILNSLRIFNFIENFNKIKNSQTVVIDKQKIFLQSQFQRNIPTSAHAKKYRSRFGIKIPVTRAIIVRSIAQIFRI